jgi:polar amino acid transport system substrate-binding protein
MGTPKSRGTLASQHLQAFVEEMKGSGFVASALQRHQIKGASVAPVMTQTAGP